MIANGDASDIKQPGKLFCWNCGLTESMRPANWHGPWYLQIAHIASGQGRAIRVDDKRAVVLLDPRCHDLHVSDSDRLPTKWINGKEYPTIDERHTLWMKQQLDGPIDWQYIEGIWNGLPPSPEPPPMYWRKVFTSNTGIFR